LLLFHPWLEKNFQNKGWKNLGQEILDDSCSAG
jgi:hypothetical protein